MSEARSFARGFYQQEFLKEAKRLVEKGLSETGLKRSKAKLLGQHTIARQELGHLAISTALDELYGLGFDNYVKEDAKYADVTLEEVQRIAAKYLGSNNYVSAITAPE